MSVWITYAPWGESLAELTEAARQAERAGAEVVWAPEMHRSATISAAALAAGTESSMIGTAVTLAFTRSPMITALEAMDIDELSNGRFILGLGTGVRGVNENWHNVRWESPVPHLRETVSVIRQIVANSHRGEPMQYQGECEHLRIVGYQRPAPPVRTSIPIYLGGVGPAMTRLAGRIADGWISHELCSPLALRETALPALEQGLTQAGRTRRDLEVVVSAVCSIDDDPATARRWAAGGVGFYATVRSYADFFALHGLGEDQQRIVDRFAQGDVTSSYLGDYVSDRMIDQLTLTGTAEQVRQRLAEYEGLADAVKLSPPTHGLPPEVIRQAQQRLIAAIASWS
ncbi:LLM class flavin-dependent oxidoreductase [Micromonospora sonneratiae]|uniref:LLM class flavin-dependent oxidoreductase n=1 Tax=Micromonospora sonneratiae TaxID=1184706 RepID=A0ABW3Y5T4_9ACTN